MNKRLNVLLIDILDATNEVLKNVDQDVPAYEIMLLGYRIKQLTPFLTKSQNLELTNEDFVALDSLLESFGYGQRRASILMNEGE